MEHSYALRHRVPLSVLSMDLDHFKQINDTRGPPAGDAVLRTMAETVHALVRNEDLFARYGGEELAIIARGNDVRGASQLAGVRSTIEARLVRHEEEILRVTASVGVATMDEAHRSRAPRSCSPPPTAPSTRPRTRAATACASRSPECSV